MRYFMWDDVFTVMDADEAKRYISSYGLFGDSASELKIALQEKRLYKLHEILGLSEDKRFCALRSGVEESVKAYAFFLPTSRIRLVKIKGEE